MRRNSAAATILLGGLIAGAFDIVYAIVFSGLRGVPATRVLQSVASGLVGAPAFQGGMPMAVLGFVLHFLMAILIGVIFYFASRRLLFLTRRPVVWGSLYGLGVYLVMKFVVIPLSAFPGKMLYAPLVVSTSLIVHMFLFGVPIALAARKASGEGAAAPVPRSAFG